MADGRANRRRTPWASRRAISWLRCSAERRLGSSGRIKQSISQVGIARVRSVCERVCHNPQGRGKLHSAAWRHHHDASELSCRIASICGSRKKAGNPRGDGPGRHRFHVDGRKCSALSRNGDGAPRLPRIRIVCNLHAPGPIWQTRWHEDRNWAISSARKNCNGHQCLDRKAPFVC
jgi:hypothetical protein